MTHILWLSLRCPAEMVRRARTRMRSGLTRAVALATALWLLPPSSPAAPGDVDPSFNSDLGPGAAVYALALQTNGQVLASGAFFSTNVNYWVNVWRLNPNGGLDTNYNLFLGTGGQNSPVATMAVAPDGQALLGGSFNQINSTPEWDLARVSAQGAPDTNFTPQLGFYEGVSALVVQTNADITVGGQLYVTIDGTNNFTGIARLHSDGSRDSSFNSVTSLGGINPVGVWVLAVQPDGKVLLGGSFFSVDGASRVNLARLNTNGSLDTSFDPGNLVPAWVHALALQPDGKVVVGTENSTAYGPVPTNLVRLNVDGSLDPTFQPGAANGPIYALALQPDGAVVVGGAFTTLNGTNRSYLARVKADGALDPAYTPQADGKVRRLLLQPDGNLLVGGSFTSINGMSSPGLARLLGEPVLLGLEPAGVRVVLNWSNPAFSLQSAPGIFGPFTNVPGAVSPYTNRLSPPGQFFRLAYP